MLLPTSLLGAGEPSSMASVGGISARRPSGAATPGSGTEGNALDDLTDEEKARILRRHLVSRQERDGPSSRGSVSGGSDNGAMSKRSSFSHPHAQREDSEPFPVPYHAPGADVT